MDRKNKIELLELLKNRQITNDQFAQRIRNDGKTIFHVVIKKVNGTYSYEGRTHTKKEIDKLKSKIKPNRKINICPKDYYK